MTLTFDLSTENWHPLIRVIGSVHVTFDFSTFSFVLELGAHTGQTDGQTGKMRNAAYRMVA